MVAEIVRTDTQECFPLGDFAIFGRGQGAGIQIADASVSREHATIRRQGDSYWITDLGSSNGTLTNGLRVTAALKLSDGDSIQFGAVGFTFHSANSSKVTDRDDETMFQTQMLQRQESPVDSTHAVLLVADLCGFTKMSAELPDEELARLINRWYESCRSILGQREATIDKFIGDCVFAYWRTSDPRSRKLAYDAARCLADGDSALTPTRQLVLNENALEFDCRVGLHAGDIVLGGETSSDYTALGDAVNLTFRVESFTRNLDSKILCTADFLDGWPDGADYFENRGAHGLKGISTPTELYSAVDQ